VAGVTADLFAGTAVSDLPRAVAWYSQVFGSPPAFRPNEKEAVWELAGERHLFVEFRPDAAARHERAAVDNVGPGRRTDDSCAVTLVTSTRPSVHDVPMGTAPDHQRLTVNGELFEVNYDPDQPGAYHFVWLSGPNPGYGFTTRVSSHRRQPQQLLIDSATGFLEQVDPQTGFIED
jgi:catechol 2,3-dioxygenase-like lactoylglutathione lyase family enzyme